MRWWIWILIFFACELFFLYVAPPLFGLTAWIFLKSYFGDDFTEDASAIAADDDEKFCQLLFGRFVEKNLSLHWRALRIIETLIGLGVADDESHGTAKRAIQRAIDEPILPSGQPLLNFISMGGGDLVCDSCWGCFIVFVADAKVLRKAKTGEEREALRKFHRLIWQQKFFIFIAKNVLPRFLPAMTYDPKIERLI